METGFSSKVQAAQFCTSVQYLLTFTLFSTNERIADVFDNTSNGQKQPKAL